MTCIVALKHDGVVTMVGDNLASNGHTKHTVVASKVFGNDNFLVGYTESFRLGAVLEYVWEPPEKTPSDSDDKYLHVDVVESLKDTISEHCPKSTDHTTYFLFAWNGRLFSYEGEGFLIEHELYASVGSGAETANGAMYALTKTDKLTYPDDVCKLAVEAAANHIVSVGNKITGITF